MANNKLQQNSDTTTITDSNNNNSNNNNNNSNSTENPTNNSSWFRSWRAAPTTNSQTSLNTKQPSEKATINDTNNDNNNGNDLVKNDTSSKEKTEQDNSQVEMNGNDTNELIQNDSNSSNNNSNNNNDISNTSNNNNSSYSIWSWFGKTEANSEVSINNNKDSEVNLTNQNENNSKEQSSTDTALSDSPESLKSSDSIIIHTNNEANGNNNNQSASENKSWRSYFFSSSSTNVSSATLSNENKNNASNDTLIDNIDNNNSDSVIIEPTTSTQNDLLPEQQQQQQKASSPEKKLTKSKNIVLPTIKSQFSIPAPNQTLLSKTINVINSWFSNPSAHVNDNISNFIKEMKAHPENAANKKFVVIGVHGWFPARLVRSVVGQPTGTSAKFCEEMAMALRNYFQQEHGLTLPLNCITTIPLQWEGKVEERVDKLYSFLVDNPANVDAIASSDIVFWTTHSQGTPVSSILIDRLLQNNIFNLKKQPVCFFAMAGIAHGPFAYLKGNLIVKYFEADAARELFEFMDSNSEISKRFQQSLNSILKQGIKTILIGSMEDQVVPLYSSIMAGSEHPNIFRALYIDGHIYSEDDFLINLIVFAIQLRNAGLSDHGLLIHISSVLAGNLYSWEGGHSTIYEEPSVYGLAPRYMFDTHPIGKLVINHQELLLPSNNNNGKINNGTLDAKMGEFKAKLRLNPYYLTWAMRGIFDDKRINDVFGNELNRLRILFDQWNPTSTKLREIKYRLEPIKAKL